MKSAREIRHSNAAFVEALDERYKSDPDFRRRVAVVAERFPWMAVPKRESARDE